MAEDMKWTWMGSGQWSKTFNGKQAILDELWSAVRKTLKPPYKVHAQRFIADGDYVVVEAKGESTTLEAKSMTTNIVGYAIFQEERYMS